MTCVLCTLPASAHLYATPIVGSKIHWDRDRDHHFVIIDRLPIYPLCGILNCPWHRHQTDGTNVFLFIFQPSPTMWGERNCVSVELVAGGVESPFSRPLHWYQLQVARSGKDYIRCSTARPMLTTKHIWYTPSWNKGIIHLVAYVMVQQKLYILSWNKMLGDVFKIYMYMFGTLCTIIIMYRMKITASITFTEICIVRIELI